MACPEIIQKFMAETFQIPYYMRHSINVKFSQRTAEWRIEGKTAMGKGDIMSCETYGTSRANAYKILEETLNLKDVRIYDTIEGDDGKPKRVLNKRETMLAQQKQQSIKDAFANWIWQDPQRRISLVRQYNELFNSTRPREYNGEHIHFVGMNPEISLREHQRNAIAHVLYGGNTLLAHEVGAGKPSRWQPPLWRQNDWACVRKVFCCPQPPDGAVGGRISAPLSECKTFGCTAQEL